jgi:DNA-binding NtrC family response regulator
MDGRLLVIEDDVVHGAVIRLMAEKAGYTVTVATSIARAMEWLRASEFDCVTLDLSLGELSGVQAMEALSASNRDMPIIIISGAADDRCEAAVAYGKALKLNVYPPVSKPVALGALREMLVAILAQSRAPAA